MKYFVVIMAVLVATSAGAMNDTANMVRRCEGVMVTNADNYILRCRAEEKIKAAIADGVPMFFPADNGGDTRGTFLDTIPDDNDYIYVNVVKNSPDTRYSDQICYRFITEKDVRRDGVYAVQICEYERADYYM
ncbi:hypothetical protein HDR66_03805 [bacterium]|nr:hypothetical protein [bacterium]